MRLCQLLNTEHAVLNCHPLLLAVTEVGLDAGVVAHDLGDPRDVALEEGGGLALAVDEVADPHALLGVEGHTDDVAELHLVGENARGEEVAVAVRQKRGHRAAVAHADELLVGQVAHGLLAEVEGVLDALLEGEAGPVLELGRLYHLA